MKKNWKNNKSHRNGKPGYWEDGEWQEEGRSRKARWKGERGQRERGQRGGYFDDYELERWRVGQAPVWDSE